MDKTPSDFLDAVREAAATESAAVSFMESQRWGTDPACPRCGDVNVYPMRDRKTGERERNFRWRCRGCTRMFSVRTGTVMEETGLPLRHWVHAFWRACASKKGVSALQISRETGITYKSALFLMHRIRLAMSTDWSKAPKLAGVVEADETFVGGKPRYSIKGQTGRGTKKARVSAMVERGGSVRVRHIAAITAKNLQSAIFDNVDPSATVMTDDERSYAGLWKRHPGPHHKITHSKGLYVRGEVHTNTVEGFFSLIKRGMYGTFHAVSKHHLHRYLDEFEFRYNHRKINDGERVIAAIRGAENKRLIYRQ